MITCKIVSNGISLYPVLPVERSVIQVEDSRRQKLSTTLRVAYYGAKAYMAYGLPGATEDELTEWINAHPADTSFAHTDERGVTRTMRRTSFAFPLSRTEPDVEGGLSTSGAGFYDISVEVEEV